MLDDAATTPPNPVNVYFKTAQNYVCCDATWATYLKAAPPQYPSINFTVVGTNLCMTPRHAHPDANWLPAAGGPLSWSAPE